MKMMFENFSPPSPRRALTLVEVLAALVILGTLLAGMVMAKARHTRQIALTRQRQDALRLADQLLSRWWASPAGVPVNARGIADPDNLWTWETRLVNNPAIEDLGARVVRVEVRPASANVGDGPSDGPSTVAVELVLPDPEKSSKNSLESGQNTSNLGQNSSPERP